jgi:hypothetical protein
MKGSVINNNVQSKRTKDFAAVFASLLVYLIAGCLLIKYYRYQINPDGLSYISIAQKYLNGDFSNAVNGWWGPFISWLLIPFLYFTSDALLAGKVLSLLIGLVVIIALHILSYRFEITESIRKVILFSAVPVVLSFALSDITPDLLLACMLLFYLTVIFSADYTARIGKGILCGVLGSFVYLSKSFGFPFFVSHFFIMNVLWYFRSETRQAKKKVVCNFLAGAVVFALISGAWIGLLSNKYGQLTFGTTGKASYRTKVVPGSQGLATLQQGFWEPSNKTAMSAWEDPSSWDFVRNQLSFTAGLIGKIAGFFMDVSALSIGIAIAYVLFWLQRFNIKTMPAEVLFPTITIAIFAGGYSLIWVRERYLWSLFVLSMLMGGYVLARLFKNNFFTKAKRMALLIIFFLSFAVPASYSLRDYAHRGKWAYNLGQALKNVIPAKSKIASNTNWAGSLFLSYHLDCKYYGAQKKNISKIELKKQLEKYGIVYYLVWGGAVDLRFLSNYEEITGGRLPGLRIYGLKKLR